MKDTANIIMTVLFVIFVLAVIIGVWSTEITQWLQIGVRDAKIQDLLYLGLVLLSLSNFTKTAKR